MINFEVGDIIIANTSYIQKILKPSTTDKIVKNSLATLGLLGKDKAEVTAIEIKGLPTGEAYQTITILPLNQNNPLFRGKGTRQAGSEDGALIYFASEDDLNSSFESAGAYLEDKCFVKALNSTGSTIPKNAVLRQTGFDATQQMPTVALASATTAATAIVFGIAEEEIESGGCGVVLTNGSYVADTSAFSINDAVYVSDTPGEISTSPGTEEVIMGRVVIAATEGVISIFSILTGGNSPSLSETGFFTLYNPSFPYGIGHYISPTWNNRPRGEGAFTHGRRVSVFDDNGFAQGYRARARSASFAQGAPSVGYSFGYTYTNNYCFAQGLGVRAGYRRYNFHQGAKTRYSYGISTSSYQLKQGINNSIRQSCSIVQGVAHGRNYYAYGFRYGGFAQGTKCHFDRYACFVQGYYARTYREDCFAQGEQVYVMDGAGFCQGKIAWTGFGCFMQGYYLNWYSAAYDYKFVQGARIYDYSNAVGSLHQGCDLRSYGNDVWNGSTNITGGRFVQGANHLVSNTDTFTQGYNLYNSFRRSLMQGENFGLYDQDARSWGSNAPKTNNAHSGFIVRHARTSDATPTLLTRVDTAFAGDVTAVTGTITARKGSTGPEAASFKIKALAYNEPGSGTITLVGTPTVTKIDTGGVAGSIDVDIVAGPDLNINVIGNANLWEWLGHIKFVKLRAEVVP